MANINAMIAQGVQPLRVESPLNVMAQMSQLQAAQGANQLRQMQMEQAMRQQEQENVLRQRLATGRPLTAQEALISGPAGIQAFQFQRGQEELERQKEERKQGVIAEGLLMVKDKPTLDNVAQAFRMLKERGYDMGTTAAEMMLMDDEQRKNAINAYISTTPGMAQRLAELEKTGAETARARAAAGASLTQQQKAAMEMAGTLPMTEFQRRQLEQERVPTSVRELRSFQAMSPEEQQAFIDLQAAKRPTTTIETPVPVVDPATGRVTYVTRQEAVGKTPPQFMEGITPRERQQREAKLPAARQAILAFESKTDKLASQIQELINHPGLNQITGLVGGRLIGITDAGRRAEALYDSIIAQGGFSELQALRDASTTGGALGNVSNREGEQLRDAFGVLKRTQSLEDFKRGLADVQRSLQSAKTRTREAFEDTYAYREGIEQKPAPTLAPAPASAPAAAGKPEKAIPPVPKNFEFDPELWKYMSDEDRKLWLK